MRIFHLWRWEPGAPRPQTLQVFETCAALARAGAEVSLVANAPPDGLDAVLRREGWVVPSGLQMLLLPHQRGLASVAFHRHLLKFVMDRRPGLVLARRLDLAASLLPFLGSVLAPSFRILCEWHEIPSVLAEFRGDGVAARRWLRTEQLLLNRLPFHSFISGGLSRDVILRVGTPARGEVIPNGAWPSPPHGEVRARQLVMASLFRKPSEIKQLTSILDSLPPGWTLHVFAPGPPPLDHSALVWRGLVSREQVSLAMASATAILCPFSRDYTRTYWDSPLKLWQALGCGRMVITTDLPAVREVVGDAPAALFLEPDTFTGLTPLLEGLDAFPQQYTPHLQYAQQRASSWTWDHRAAAILRLAEEVMG